jgi:hypothetical protein
MNHREREDRRIEADRRVAEEESRKTCPLINRAHRDAERECLDLKDRINELDMQLSERILMDEMDINALKEAGLWNNYYGNPNSLYIVQRIKALESLLAESGSVIYCLAKEYGSYIGLHDTRRMLELCEGIDAILPKTEEVK